MHTLLKKPLVLFLISSLAALALPVRLTEDGAQPRLASPLPSEALAPRLACWFVSSSERSTPRREIGGSTAALVALRDSFDEPLNHFGRKGNTWLDQRMERWAESRWIAHSYSAAVAPQLAVTPQPEPAPKDIVAQFLENVGIHDGSLDQLAEILRELRFPPYVWQKLIDIWAPARILPNAQLSATEIFHATRGRVSRRTFIQTIRTLMHPWLQQLQTEKRLASMPRPTAIAPKPPTLLQLIIEAWDWGTDEPPESKLYQLVDVLRPIYKETGRFGIFQINSDWFRIYLTDLWPFQAYCFRFAWYPRWGLLFFADHLATQMTRVYRTTPRRWHSGIKQQTRVAEFWFDSATRNVIRLLEETNDGRLDERLLKGAL